MKKRSVLLITDNLYEEPFLIQELWFLEKSFAITIITGKPKNPLCSVRDGSWHVHIIKNHLHFTDFLKGIIALSTSKDLWREVFDIFRTKEQILKRISTAVRMYLKAKKFSKKLEKLHIVEDQQIIYTYWHNYKMLGAGMLLDKLQRRDIPIVSRIHGYDLFNERERGGRQAFKTVMDGYLSALFFVSQKGYDYYKDTFGFQPSCEYILARLGVLGSSCVMSHNEEYDLSIISVANAIPLKRIHLIIEALAEIDEYSVNWTHFGDGNSLEQLKLLAEEKLKIKSNIEYSFKGSVPNEEIYDYYLNNKLDAFITTSSTEGGCPVSIQEAFSFGVPAIGTDVGGIPEILFDGENGFLLSDTPSLEEIRQAIMLMIREKQNNEWESLSMNARRTWQKLFDAKYNYSVFSEDLSRIASV